MSRDVVVTGLGVVSPVGNGVEAFWASLMAGRPNVAPIEVFDASPYRVRIAQTLSPDDRGPGDPAVAFLLSAAAEAIAQAALDGPALSQCGLALATTAAGWTASAPAFNAFRQGRSPTPSELDSPPDLFKEALLYAVAARFGLNGPSALLSPACAAASSAIAWAAQRIRDGDANLMLAGATDALTEVVFAGFHAMRLLADDACRPFSAGRRGLVLSEGAAVLVLESAPHAHERGARALARLGGWGLSCDAAHPTTPVSDGMLRAMQAALEDAGLQPCDVAQVSAHGTGSAANDAAEARAIETLLGAHLRQVPVTAIKGTTGHTEGAAGAFGALAGVLSLQDGALPPLAGYTATDPSLPPLRLTPGAPRHHAGRNVLVNASGFGGANAALVFEKSGARHREAAAGTGRAVITASVALTARDGALPEPDEAFWPGGPSLPLDRISSLVARGAQELLGASPPAELDPDCAVVLATTYGSQARHERIWTALAEQGPIGVDPNDFALSTFNAPGSAVAAAYGYRGAGLIFLGPTGGAAAIEEAIRLIATGRARRVLAGAYEEITPFFRHVLTGLGEGAASESVCLVAIEDEQSARQVGASALATVLGHASRAPVTPWPDETAIFATMRMALERACLHPSDLAAILLDPHATSRRAQLAAIDRLFAGPVTLIELEPVYGNCLAASTPLALHVALAGASTGRWPSEAVLRGNAAFTSGCPVLINACGFMSGCCALVVQPHGVQ